MNFLNDDNLIKSSDEVGHIRAGIAENELTYRKILVPIDLSEQSRKTVSYAARLASRYNATLQLLQVIDISDFTPIHYQYRQESADRHKSELNAAEGEALESLALSKISCGIEETK